jgi:hypothetical protein
MVSIRKIPKDESDDDKKITVKIKLLGLLFWMD